MPIVDMPLEQLKVYNGINPRPADFEEYWARALSELDAQPDRLELIPAKFQAPNAECFNLYFSGVGGARIYAMYLRPKNAPAPHPAVVIFHGYHGSSGEWQDKLAYVNAGFSVFALDARGQGGLSEDRTSIHGTTISGHIIRGLDDHEDKLLFRQIFLDTAQLTRIAMSMPEVDAERVGCFGGSQGGGLTLACASLVPGIKRAAPAYPFLSDYRRTWEMDLAKNAYAELATYFRAYDPTHSREQEIFTKLGYIDIQNLTKRIKAEVLMGTGLMDTICPPSTQFAAYNKITSNKQVVVYPDYGHENIKGFNDIVYEFMMGL